MKEQLISLETAILAKEKGFEQNPYLVQDAYGPTYVDGSDIKLRSSSLFNPDTNSCTAPSQSLLQKWLREEHKVHLVIEPIISNEDGDIVSYDKPYGYSYTVLSSLINPYDNNDFEDTDIFNTFEEALETSLIEALKLIK